MPTRNDAEGTVLAKQDLERALEEAKREATRAQLQALDVEACIRLVSNQAADATSLDTKEAELSSKLKSKALQHLEESLVGIMSEAHHMARKELGAELECHRAEDMAKGE
ncbi:hypothetical protein ACLOJK_007121 [Asimina triloba]